MTFRRLLAAIAACVLAYTAVPTPRVHAQSAAAAAVVQTLPNGLRVVVLEDHASPVVQVATWYRFGAGYETPGKTGLAHGLEHMMFRGTPALSGAGLDDLGARLGADFNAQTTNEYTHYYFTVPADRMDLMVHLEADRMHNLKLTDADWNLEKQAVLQEYDQDYSQPFFSFLFGINDKLYPNSQLARPALGVRADIVKSKAADLRRYYDEYYAPNNATLVITGDVTAAAAIASVQTWFGPLKPHALPAKTLTTADAASGGTVALSAEFPFDIVDLAYAIPGDNPSSEVDLDRVELATSALQNERGPIRKALVDSGLTLATAIVPLTDRHVSTAHVFAVVAPGHTADEVRDTLRKTLDTTIAAGFNPDFVEAARRSAVADVTYARDSISGLGDSIGSSYVFPGDTTPEQSLAILNTVSVADVNAAAKKYFASPNVIGILKPTTTDPNKAKAPSNLSGTVSDNFTGRTPNGPIVQAAWVKAGLRKPVDVKSTLRPTAFTLPNGIRVLVQEVHDNPTVFINGTIRSSPTFDPSGKEGLGSVTSSLLAYGSAKYDFDAQRKVGDDLAATLGFGSSFSARGFAKDFHALADVLADSVQHPTFPSDRFALVKGQFSANASRRALDPSYRSNRAFREALYPAGDPILREDSPASIAAITADDVKGYAQTYFRPDLTSIIVVGDVKAADVQTELTNEFGSWSATGPKPDPRLPPLPLPKAARKLVETPAHDVSVELGTTALARTNPDYNTFVLMNSVLGNGGFDSRLMQEVRVKRGLVYNVSSSLSAGRDRGTFVVGFRAVPAKVDSATAIVEREMRRLQTQPIPISELNRQKIRITAGALIDQQSTESLVGALGNILANDLPLDYYVTLGARYARITPADVQRVAKQYLHPNNLVEVRTGPKS